MNTAAVSLRDWDPRTVVDPRRRKFTVEEYYRMAEAGILSEDDRVELIEGEIIEMSPIGDRHASEVTRIDWLFQPLVRGRALVLVQNPVHLSHISEPQPDIVLARHRDDFYRGGHPRPEDVLLAIEVMDTSHVYDRGFKARLYARFGIPELWLVDIPNRVIELMREPSPDGYRLMMVREPGERISLQALPDVELAVEEVLGEE